MAQYIHNQYFRPVLIAALKVDYNKLAELAGMSNPKSAANAWAKIKPKLFSGDGVTAAPKATKPVTPRKPKAKAKAEAEEGDEINVLPSVETNGKGATPKTSPRKRKPAVKKEDDGEGSPKKRGRKSKKALEEEAGQFFGPLTLYEHLSLLASQLPSRTKTMARMPVKPQP